MLGNTTFLICAVLVGELIRFVLTHRFQRLRFSIYYLTK